MEIKEIANSNNTNQQQMKPEVGSWKDQQNWQTSG